MKAIQLGRSDVRCSSIMMGTSQAGKTHWTGIEDDSIQSAIQSSIDVGVTAFDTSEHYGDGYSEKALGKALAGSRKKVALLSKVFANHLKYDQVITSCEHSLIHLNTDYLDLYQIHWPSGSWNSEVVPIEETLAALVDLKKQGKIRAIGVSNFSLKQLREASQWCRIDSIQLPYSLFWRYLETEIYPFCEENQITILSYAPLSQGFLTGKFKNGHQFQKGDHRALNKLFLPEVFPHVLDALKDLEAKACEMNLSLTQLALRWVISHSNTGAVVGVRGPTQIQENAVSGKDFFSKTEMDALSALAWRVAKQFMDSPLIWTFKV